MSASLGMRSHLPVAALLESVADRRDHVQDQPHADDPDQDTGSQQWPGRANAAGPHQPGDGQEEAAEEGEIDPARRSQCGGGQRDGPAPAQAVAALGGGQLPAQQPQRGQQRQGHQVVGREEQVVLAAPEMVRQEGEQQARGQHRQGMGAELTQDEHPAERAEQERREEEQVGDQEDVAPAQAAQPDEQEVRPSATGQSFMLNPNGAAARSLSAYDPLSRVFSTHSRLRIESPPSYSGTRRSTPLKFSTKKTATAASAAAATYSSSSRPNEHAFMVLSE